MRVPTWNVEIGHGHFFFPAYLELTQLTLELEWGVNIINVKIHQSDRT